MAPLKSGLTYQLLLVLTTTWLLHPSPSALPISDLTPLFGLANKQSLSQARKLPGLLGQQQDAINK